MCQHFNCLPRAGGLFDQDAWVMEAFKVVAAARQAKAEADQKMEAAQRAAGARARKH